MYSVASAVACGGGVVLNGSTSANLHKNHAPQGRLQAPIHHCEPHRQMAPILNNHLQIPGPWTFFRNPDYKPLEMITDHGVPPSVQSVESIKSLVVIQIFSKLESVKHSGLLLDFCIISPSFYNRLCLLLPCANGSSSQALRP